MHTEVDNLCTIDSWPELQVGITWKPTPEILINWSGMTLGHQLLKTALAGDFKVLPRLRTSPLCEARRSECQQATVHLQLNGGEMGLLSLWNIFVR